mgnify:CR=1 FL=1
MRLINKAGLLAVALTTLLILASCSDSNTSTGVTAGRDAAKEILPDDESTCPLFSEGFACEMKKLMCNVGDIYTNQRAAQCQYQGYDICWQEGQPRACLGDASGVHDGDATVDDPTGLPETDTGGGRDGDGHPVTPLYYASLEQCQNGKKHGDWVLYTQHCYDAGKSACLAYVKHWSKRYDGWLYVPGWVVEDGKSYEQRCESKKADANGMIGLKSFECIAESCALTGKLGYYRDSCDTSYLEFGTSNGLMCPGGMPR